ncbi:MAG: hypothetical protein WAV41_02900 [Microgenomates group bacterium]
MNTTNSSLKDRAKLLRKEGHTYSQINSILDTSVPKSTLSSWLKDIPLSKKAVSKIQKINNDNLIKARKSAINGNYLKQQKYLESINFKNKPVALHITNFDTGMIALSMLCLGEASKAKSKHRSFSLGSSDPRIIIIFLKLLKRFSNFDITKIRCTVQCRADQNTKTLERYWQKVTQIPFDQFYSTRIDQRTINKPTKNTEYKGVLVIDYYNRNTQLILESLANLVYNQLLNEGS